MSLHLGNLSRHIRRDELERVFRRFGHCNVQIKDKFGFVVYDFPANAEKALRTLEGKNICGEPITLSWSNRQPRSFQRFERGSRSYEQQRGRHPGGADYVDQRLVSNGRRVYRQRFGQRDSDGGRLNSSDLVDEVVNHHQDSANDQVGENYHNFREDMPNEGGVDQQNLLENDRWGEQVGDPVTENVAENGLDFDRYDPYDDDDDRRNKDEYHHLNPSGGSPNSRKTQEKTGIEKIDEVALNHRSYTKSRQTCYICGEWGHKMRNCPRENPSQRQKLNRFDHRLDNEISHRGRGEGELKRFASKSQESLPSSRDAVSLRQYRSHRKVSHSRKHRGFMKSGRSPAADETHRSRRKEGNKQKRRDNGSPEIRHAKKARRLVSSPYHSDSTASRSHMHSKSSKFESGSGSHSRLRSISSRTNSRSSNSMSGSRLHNSRPGSFKSQSSPSTSLSLSVSLGRPLPSPPNKALAIAASPKSSVGLVEPEHLVEIVAGPDDHKIEDTIVAVENENAVAHFNLDEDMDKEHSQRRDYKNHTVPWVSGEVKDSGNLPPQGGDFTGVSLSALKVAKELDPHVLTTEHMLAMPKTTESEISERSHTSNLMNIPSKEIYMVLKHYGLEHPVENEEDLSAESFFGSARLWPWEIIYYRRLRKGPISTENYARRIAQNEEFGIVDKYIRSSSGWGELGLDYS